MADLDAGLRGGAQPVAVGGEAQGMDDVSRLQGVQALGICEIPQHGNTVLHTCMHSCSHLALHSCSHVSAELHVTCLQDKRWLLASCMSSMRLLQCKHEVEPVQC